MPAAASALERATSLPAYADLSATADNTIQPAADGGEVPASAMPDGAPAACSVSPAATAFSPVFDLELGGSSSSLVRLKHDLSQSNGAQLRCYNLLAGGGSGAAALAAAARHPLHAPPQRSAAPAVGALDRSQSDLQVMMLSHPGAAAAAAKPFNNQCAQLMELCKPTTELELALSRRLRAFRNARISKPAKTPTSPAAQGVPGRSDSRVPPPAPIAAATAAAGPTPGEIEALATELLMDGFAVQIRDGARAHSDARMCLRTLKHRFLVCVGWARGEQEHASQAGQAQHAHAALPTVAEAAAVGVNEGGRLACPLVVEPRFREQFLIANPSREYEHLLLALPVVFVGPLRRLDAAVSVMAEAVAAAFKQAGRPLPPWRTKGAMLSKWAPEQLAELERLMAQLPRQPSVQEADATWGLAGMVPGTAAAAAPAPTSAECRRSVTAEGTAGEMQEEGGGDAAGPRSNSEPTVRLPAHTRVLHWGGGEGGGWATPEEEAHAEAEGAAEAVAAGPASGSSAQSESAGEDAVQSLGLGLARIQQPPAQARGDAPTLGLAVAAMREWASGGGGARGPPAAAPPALAHGEDAPEGRVHGGEASEGLTFPVLREALPDVALALARSDTAALSLPPPLLPPPPPPPAAPLLPRAGSPFTPFASVSMPEVGAEVGTDAGSDVFGPMSPLTVDGTYGPHCLPEFTLKHNALEQEEELLQQQLLRSERYHLQHPHAHTARRAHAEAAATLPVPTPPRPASAFAGVESPPEEHSGLHAASRLAPAPAPAMAPLRGHAPVAAAHGGGHPAAGAGAAGGGGGVHLQMASVLRITRRSSSDLSRAALKFKNARSALAAALKRVTAGKDSGGGAGDAAARLGAGGGGQPSRESRDGGGGHTPRKSVDGGGQQSSQVPLPGGVLTRPCAAEPAWARIATVRWNQQPAAEGATGAAVARQG